MGRRQSPLPLILIGLAVVLLIFSFAKLFQTDGRKAEHVVKEFYKHEQLQQHSQAWELLHPIVQDKFPKTSFIQDRNHVFFGHFGAEAYSFHIKNSGKNKNWRAVKDGDVLHNAHHFTVKKEYRGKYGHFYFIQEVYVVKEEGKWMIVWDFK
ncbi:hypothetical protein [Bacillus alkalisoli]|uniref:hypothetical protein n=1 Tax=Bacillus alkalisoli TaxID=2011008 RepID=UPI000C23FA7C|nr:hypothetical protein [Bacillus alkalisoli]